MDVNPVSLLYHFKFEGGSIFELCFNGLTSDSNKSERFQWILIHNNARYNLKYLSMKEGSREFTCALGYICLNMETKKLRISGVGNDITKDIVNV